MFCVCFVFGRAIFDSGRTLSLVLPVTLRPEITHFLNFLAKRNVVLILDLIFETSFHFFLSATKKLCF